MLSRGGAVLAAVLCAVGLSLPTPDSDVLTVLLITNRPIRRVLFVAVGGTAVMSLAALVLWRQGAMQAYLQVALPSEHAYLVWSNGGKLGPPPVPPPPFFPAT